MDGFLRELFCKPTRSGGSYLSRVLIAQVNLCGRGGYDAIKLIDVLFDLLRLSKINLTSHISAPYLQTRKIGVKQMSLRLKEFVSSQEPITGSVQLHYIPVTAFL